MTTTTTEEAPGTDLVPAEVLTGEVLPAVLPEKDAKALDRKIVSASAKVGSARDTLLQLMTQAVEGEIWRVLKRDDGSDYRSVSDYFGDRVQISPADTNERKLMVAMMNQKGLTERTISDSLRVAPSTVHKDIATASDRAVDKTPAAKTGRDGKTRTTKPKKPAGKTKANTSKPSPLMPLTLAIEEVKAAANGLARRSTFPDDQLEAIDTKLIPRLHGVIGQLQDIVAKHTAAPAA